MSHSAAVSIVNKCFTLDVYGKERFNTIAVRVSFFWNCAVAHPAAAAEAEDTKRGRAQNGSSSEPVIDSDTHEVGREPVVRSGEQIGLLRKVDEEVLDFRRHVLGDAELDAAAGAPAEVRLAFGGTENLGAQAAKRDPERSVDQHLVQREPDAAARGAEPGIGELPCREGVLGGGGLQVRFDPEHELAGLPIVAGLTTAADAGRMGAVAGDIAPLVAEVRAQIRSGPAVGAYRRGGGEGRLVSGDGRAGQRRGHRGRERKHERRRNHAQRGADCATSRPPHPASRPMPLAVPPPHGASRRPRERRVLLGNVDRRGRRSGGTGTLSWGEILF